MLRQVPRRHLLRIQTIPERPEFSLHLVPRSQGPRRQGVQSDKFHAHDILGFRHLLLGLEHLHIRLHRFELRAFAGSDAGSYNARHLLNNLQVLLKQVYRPFRQQQFVECLLHLRNEIELGFVEADRRTG